MKTDSSAVVFPPPANIDTLWKSETDSTELKFQTTTLGVKNFLDYAISLKCFNYINLYLRLHFLFYHLDTFFEWVNISARGLLLTDFIPF